MTWNIHRARGCDGQVDPGRIVDRLAAEVCVPVPDVLCLQEADTDCPPHRGLLDLDRLASVTGLRSVQDRADLRWGPESHGFLGTVLFFGPGVTARAVRVIDLPGYCHRGAVVADAEHGGQPVRLIGLHLSLAQALRVVQMRVIGQVLARLPPMPTVLLGDLNEWRPWGGLALSRAVLGRRLAGQALATFPAARPLLPLDRILSDLPGAVTEARVMDSPALRAASDHLPLRAQVLLGLG